MEGADANTVKKSTTEESPQSGWDTPENVAKIIEKAPLLIDMMKAGHAAKEAEILAGERISTRGLWVVGIISAGVVAVAIIDVFQNQGGALAEKLLIPLISFAGGLGVGKLAR